jgi:hypothetical protein
MRLSSSYERILVQQIVGETRAFVLFWNPRVAPKQTTICFSLPDATPASDAISPWPQRTESQSSAHSALYVWLDLENWVESPLLRSGTADGEKEPAYHLLGLHMQ